MNIPVVKPSRSEVESWVARFDEIEEVNTGLPDMHIDGFRRSFLCVLGFDDPSRDGQVSPTGNEVKPAISNVGASFGVNYVRAEPGQGVVMHVHDTNETFMAVDGDWRMFWEGDQGVDSIVLSPRDFISFPPNIMRRFECVSAGTGGDKGLLLGILPLRSDQGTPAAVEFSPEAQKIMAGEAI